MTQPNQLGDIVLSEEAPLFVRSPLTFHSVSLQIKRMKQLEQEKDILLQGLESVERAKDWYQKQIQAVQDKQKYIGKGSSPNASVPRHCFIRHLRECINAFGVSGQNPAGHPQ